MPLPRAAVACIFISASLPAEADNSLPAARTLLATIASHSAQCLKTPERMVFTCDAARHVPGHLDQLRADITVLKRRLEVEREGWLGVSESYLENSRIAQADAEHLAHLQRVQDGFQAVYKSLGLMAEVGKWAHALGLTGKPIGDWTLNEEKSEKLEFLIESGLAVWTNGDEIFDLIELHSNTGKPVEDIADYGLVGDALSLVFDSYQLRQEFKANGRNMKDLLGNFRSARPAERLVVLSYLQKLGDLWVKYDRAERSKERAEIDKVLSENHAQLARAFANLRRINDSLLLIAQIEARIGPSTQDAAACAKALCGGAGAIAVPASTPGLGPAGAEAALTERIDALRQAHDGARLVRPPLTRMLCADGTRNTKRAAQAQRLALKSALEGEIDDLVRAAERLALERSRIPPGATQAERQHRIDARLKALEQEQKLRREKLAAVEADIAAALSDWNHVWQTNFGPVAISFGSGGAQIEPRAGHIFIRHHGRYISTDFGVTSVSGEWFVPSLKLKGAFHWCLSEDAQSLTVWHRDPERNGGQWEKTTGGKLMR